MAVAWLTLARALAAPVVAENYDAFWLWAGVRPQAALSRASEIYLLAGQVSERGGVHIVSQRSDVPHVQGAKVWIVYRAQTLAWDNKIEDAILSHLESWRAAGNDVAGLEIDFDAGTRHLEAYAQFLREVRAKLPPQYHLGITGLLDWSAHGDPNGLETLSGVVDEVVLQIYQGRHVIPGYAAYLRNLSAFHLPFKIGLLQGGDWRAPEGLEQQPNFKGYVVFLLNPKP